MTTDSLDNVELIRWWHQHQVQTLGQEADRIRNGLLQDVFAARRQLELMGQPQDEVQKPRCETCLNKLETLYNELEALSDRLSSPYLQSPLPLALQHAVQPWRSQFNIETTFSANWGVEPVELTQLLIDLIEDVLCHLATLPEQPHQFCLILEHQGHSKQLSLNACYNKLPPLLEFTTWQTTASILETFQLLTQGDYVAMSNTGEFGWILHWI